MVLKHLHEYQIYRIFAPSRFICTCVVTSAKVRCSKYYCKINEVKNTSEKYYLTHRIVFCNISFAN